MLTWLWHDMGVQHDLTIMWPEVLLAFSGQLIPNRILHIRGTCIVQCNSLMLRGRHLWVVWLTDCQTGKLCAITILGMHTGGYYHEFRNHVVNIFWMLCNPVLSVYVTYLCVYAWRDLVHTIYFTDPLPASHLDLCSINYLKWKFC